MPYTLTHDPDLATIELAFTGSITGADIQESTTSCISLQKRTGATRFLIDADGWDVTASLVEIYEVPASQYWAEELDRRTRLAVILPRSTGAQEAARFYETACQNRGWNARVCPDRERAIDWLLAADNG